MSVSLNPKTRFKTLTEGRVGAHVEVMDGAWVYVHVSGCGRDGARVHMYGCEVRGCVLVVGEVISERVWL